jgi:hypothetical protein
MDRWGVSVSAAFGVSAATVSGTEGRARIGSTILGIDAVHAPWPAMALSPWVQMGLSAAVLTMSGEANPGYSAHDKSVTAFVPRAGAGLAWSASRHFRIFAGGWIGTAMPPTEVRFAGRNVGTWGRGVMGSSVGVEWLVY